MDNQVMQNNQATENDNNIVQFIAKARQSIVDRRSYMGPKQPTYDRPAVTHGNDGKMSSQE